MLLWILFCLIVQKKSKNKDITYDYGKVHTEIYQEPRQTR